MNDAGVIVVTAFISPYRLDRQSARDVIGDECFIEAFVDTPLEVCEARDPKGLYKKARAGEIRQFTGISDAYEATAECRDYPGYRGPEPCASGRPGYFQSEGTWYRQLAQLFQQYGVKGFRALQVRQVSRLVNDGQLRLGNKLEQFMTELQWHGLVFPAPEHVDGNGRFTQPCHLPVAQKPSDRSAPVF